MDLSPDAGPAEPIPAHHVRPGGAPGDRRRAGLHPVRADDAARGVVAAADRAADNGGALRFQTNVAGFDASISAAKYVSGLVYGADFSGDAGPLGVHGEGALTTALEGLGTGPVSVGERFFRAVGGVDIRPRAPRCTSLSSTTSTATVRRARPVTSRSFTSPRVTKGEVFGASRHYLGIVAAWKASPLLAVNGLLLGNRADPSAILQPFVEYWLEQHVLVRAGAFVPLGRWPDPSSLKALTPRTWSCGATLTGPPRAASVCEASTALTPLAGSSRSGCIRPEGVP